MSIYQICVLLITIVMGGISLYFQKKMEIMDLARYKIAEAEDEYRDSTKAGGQKFEWVVNSIYALVPKPMQLIFTRETVELLVQRCFDSMERYAAIQLDRAVAKVVDKVE